MGNYKKRTEYYRLKKTFKLRIHFILGIIIGLALTSCNSEKPNHYDTERILNKSLEKIIGTDSLRFFPPLILCDELSTNDTISAYNEKLREQYETRKNVFTKATKYVVLPDSLVLFYKKNQSIDSLDISKLSFNRYYEFISNSNMKAIKSESIILAQINELKIELNDSIKNATLSCSIKCDGAENGGWSTSIALEKLNNEWIIIKK